MKIKELLENRHGYDDSGMSLAPGNDEGEDSWVYSAAHDRIGAGDPRKHRHSSGGRSNHHSSYPHTAPDEPHDVYIDGRKWRTFDSEAHAKNVARKLVSNGKKAQVHKSIAESATVGATSSANIASVANPSQANSKKPVKSVDALDQDEVSLFGAPMETVKNTAGKKAAIIKRR